MPSALLVDSPLAPVQGRVLELCSHTALHCPAPASDGAWQDFFAPEERKKGSFPEHCSGLPRA